MSEQQDLVPPTPMPVATPDPLLTTDTGAITNPSDPVGAAGDPPRDFNPAPSSVSTSTFDTRLTEYLSKLMCRAQWADGSVARGIVRRALKTRFKGDLMEIERRLRSSSCAASEAMPEDVLRDMSAATDRLSDR